MSKSRVAVNVREGRLIGIVEEGCCGSYVAFKGIPYAKPPVGDLRFKDPVPAEPWSGDRDASKYGNVCIQVDFVTNTIIGDEDCLYLNVYTTDIKPPKKRAVMVWIHGGGFFCGESTSTFFGPDYIVPKDVVLVTLNYRLGALGFLNLYDKVATGNQGLKDMTLALRWVRDNISQFGGDSENVTIFGESAGGAAVHFLALSPFTKGLFHKAISQSGVVLNSWAWTEQTNDKTFEFVAKLGKETSDPKVAYEFLKTTDVKELVTVYQKDFFKKENSHVANLMFTPSMDAESSNPFFPEPIQNYINRGVKVPFMLGFTKEEGIFLVDSNFMGNFTKEDFEKTNADFKTIVHPTILSEIAKIPMTVEELRSLYFGDKPVSEENLSNLIDYFTDMVFVRGTMKTTEIQAKLKSNNTYLYRFSYASEKPTVLRAAMKTTIKGGTSHAEDICFLFSSDVLDKFGLSAPTPGSNDYKMIEYMTDLWTNFSKTGNPTPATTKKTPVTWTPLKNEDVYDYLDITIDPQMKTFHKGQERWDWETRKNKLRN
ncbi:esterase E4-like isoform X4 [Pseudomyrmex gracilis]|nr:esterase E4-like isoform X4 [Pseudomyrmex gracilis]XP_020283641.1 esterase E4-like isoform X4 [Pseudomyrmex gracilis]